MVVELSEFYYLFCSVCECNAHLYHSILESHSAQDCVQKHPGHLGWFLLFYRFVHMCKTHCKAASTHTGFESGSGRVGFHTYRLPLPVARTDHARGQSDVECHTGQTCQASVF
jgi:hypothetical protein